MESSTTDTQQSPDRGFIERHVDYWSKIDKIECELYGMPMKYFNLQDLHDGLGVNDSYSRNLLSLLRKRLSNAQ